MGQNFDHKRIPLKSNMRLPRQLGQMSGESVLKCSFSVNLAGRRSVIACGGTQLEIRSGLLYEYCCSSFLLDIYASKGEVCCSMWTGTISTNSRLNYYILLRIFRYNWTMNIYYNSYQTWITCCICIYGDVFVLCITIGAPFLLNYVDYVCLG